MSAMTKHGANGTVAIPASLPLPVLPPAADAYLRNAAQYAAQRARIAAAAPPEREAMFAGLLPSVPDLGCDDRAAARRALAALDDMARGVSLATLAAWLAPVNAAVRNPQNQPDFEARVHGLRELLSDVPAGAFTAESRRRLAPDFFPGPGDIRRALEPDAARITSHAAALRRMVERQADADAAPEPRIPPTAEQVAANRAKVAALKAGIVAASPASRRIEASPRYLPPAVLLACLEREIAAGTASEGIKARVVALRRQVAA